MVLWLLLGIFLVLYVVYYRRCVVCRPRLVCCDANNRRELEEHCPALFQNFYPTIWAPHGHMQTVARALLQSYPRHEQRRETVRMSDGGHVCLDWYNERDPSQPTLVILPGLTGSSDENYVRHWIDDVCKQEYRCIVYNYRGCGNTRLSSTKLYSGANIEDLMEVLDHISSAIPGSPLVAVGVSLGSTQLIKYLSTCKRQNKPCCLRAILLISSIWNMMETRVNLAKFVNRHTFVRFLSFKYTRILRQNRQLFEDALRSEGLSFDYHKAIATTSFEGIGETIILPMFGYSSMEDYLQDWSPCNFMDGITIPILAVNAEDDPFCPPHTLPVEEAKRNPNLMLAVLERGGHIGFTDSALPVGKCFMDRVLVQFLNAVLEHNAFTA